MASFFLSSIGKRAVACTVGGGVCFLEDKELQKERYLGYTASLARLKLVLLRAKSVAADSIRYVAYSSDVGESMRPILKPWMVNASYGVAVAYVLADAGMEVRRKQELGFDSDTLIGTGAHRLCFHAAVSLALPAVIIHTAVHQTHHVLERPFFETMPRVHRYGPTAVGIAIIPFLPVLDPPAEFLLDAAFDKVWPKWSLGNLHHHHD
ncbi:hypothetical protein CTAYLR_007638 [Chrysophaeum taylorii]|uniref:Mitochondrial fission process protein 1 n=1 Tax=Chrysophaeum taylorii TaxID=2483200 RepID=A0AAD7XQ43_9STRA|nr:hypothetical protein CTAYLR_007638 [Chrysophaeum taylorii]